MCGIAKTNRFGAYAPRELCPEDHKNVCESKNLNTTKNKTNFWASITVRGAFRIKGEERIECGGLGAPISSFREVIFYRILFKGCTEHLDDVTGTYDALKRASYEK
jgi:hypothetical protein